jgi:hypothetical protein
MEEARLEALLEEATAHCYDEEDEFWGVFSALVGRVSYPLQARMRGEAVTLVGLDGDTSDLQVGVMARVQEGDWEQTVALAELEVVDADPVSAEVLAVYRYWWGRRG